MSGDGGLARGRGALSGSDANERMRLAGLMAAKAAGSLGRAARAPFHVARALAVSTPQRLYIAPQDIRTADPTVANEIYAGYFSFDGRTLNTQGRSPFALTPPSAAWRRSLAGFSWLRHLRAADKALARANAQALVSDFLAIRKTRPDDPAFEPIVVARRTLSWLSQSPVLLDGADHDFYQRFMASLGQSVRQLSRALDGEAQCAERLFCAIAMAEFAICANASSVVQQRASQLLNNELSRQILSDGGHISRNPQTPIDLLLDLLPLRQLYVVRGIHPPKTLMTSIDRMIPMLRMLRHGDGSLALFNGMGVTAQDRLATILVHDDQPKSAPLNAPYSGYQRLEAGDAVAIVDTGAPPSGEFSNSAHAGCLSFEYSLGDERVVVNCGRASKQDASVRELARATAAHSTLVIGDRSSCRIAANSGLQKFMSGRVLSGPSFVRVDRRQLKSGQALTLSHDGYAREYGLVHERVLGFTHNGARLVGEDGLLPALEAAQLDRVADFALRFHIHPKARPSFGPDGQSVEIALPSGKRLLFEASGGTVAIEESVFFAAPGGGPSKCAQIVVSGAATPQAKIRWSFRAVEHCDAGGPVPLAPDM
jgi:uncharacterized heparinase superfamily protein